MKRKYFNLLIVICLVPTLQSCFVAGLIAAIGGGTYYVGTKAGKREDERIKTQALIDVKRELEEKEKAESVVDQGIMNQINQNYLAGTLTNNIAVYPEVRNGVVILHGRVPDAQTAERAIQAARKTPGVERIISNLVIVNQAPQAMPLNNFPQFQQFFQAPQPQMMPQQMQPEIRYEYKDVVPPQRLQYKQVPEGSMMNPNSPYLAPQQQLAPTQQRMSQSQRYNMPQNIYGNNNQRVQLNQPPPKQQSNSKTIIAKKPAPQKISQNSAKTQNTQKNIKTESNNPRLLSEETLAKYSEDNDSKYRPITSRPKNKSSNNQSSKQNNTVYVPVPVAVPVPVTNYEDNDSFYVPLGAYIPPSNNSPSQAMPVDTGIPQIPLPIADENQDNDTTFKMEYY